MGISTHRLGHPSSVWAAPELGLLLCQITRVNIYVNVSIIKCFFPPSRIYNPTVKLTLKAAAGKVFLFPFGQKVHLARSPQDLPWKDYHWGKLYIKSFSSSRSSHECRAVGHGLGLLGQGTVKQQLLRNIKTLETCGVKAWNQQQKGPLRLQACQNIYT